MVKIFIVYVAMNYIPQTRQKPVFGENACLHWCDFWALEEIHYSSQYPTAHGMPTIKVNFCGIHVATSVRDLHPDLGVRSIPPEDEH